MYIQAWLFLTQFLIQTGQSCCLGLVCWERKEIFTEITKHMAAIFAALSLNIIKLRFSIFMWVNITPDEGNTGPPSPPAPPCLRLSYRTEECLIAGQAEGISAYKCVMQCR